MLFVLLFACATAVALAHLEPRWDGMLAWALGAVLFALAGSRTGGFDHDEYLASIELARALSDDGWQAQLVVAKDPFFLLFIDVAGWITEEPQLVFLLVAAVSVACKVAASRVLHGHRTKFIAFYSLLLAPGLEFAAIRAGMAIGFVLLALASASRWRSAWFAAGIASHASVAAALVGRVWASHRRVFIVCAAFLMPLLLPLLLEYAGQDSRLASYLEDRGTLNALAMPALTLLAFVVFADARRKVRTRQALLAGSAMAATLVCVGLALVLALPLVTVAIRILEISWVLMSAQLFALASASTHVRNRLTQMGSAGMLVGILCLSNVLRQTWSVLF